MDDQRTVCPQLQIECEALVAMADRLDRATEQLAAADEALSEQVADREEDLAATRARVYARCAEIVRQTQPLCDHCQEAARAIEAEEEKVNDET